MPADPHDKPRPSDPNQLAKAESHGVKQPAAAPATKPVRQRSRAVILPGVLLIVVGVLDLLVGLGLLAGGYLILNGDTTVFRFLEPKHSEGDTIKKDQWTAADIQFYSTLLSFGAGVVTAVMAFPVMIGGSAMMRSRGWFGAVLAAVLALISPGGFCLLGLIAGIWALAVLFNPSVRQTFR